MINFDAQLIQLKATIATLEAQRSLLGDDVVDAALAPLRQQLNQFESSPTPAPPSITGERKLVTVMFADISGFTALSERLDPEQVRNLMNACFDLLVPIVQRYGGTIDKFIGDAILALFGAPIAHENHAERALRAALEMHTALSDFNTERDTALGLHFGINTGLVIAGGIGSQGQQQYSVMGDAVNLAARLEDASETGEILVGQNTYRLAAPLFVFDALPPMRVKGKAQPVPVYRLIGLKSTPGTMRGIEGLRSPMVGRDAEMAQIQGLLGALETGQGSLIAVVGEAGIGKSRLLAEARQSFGGRMTWAEGRCLSYAENLSYRVAAEILYNLIGANQEMSPQEIAAALHSSIARLLGDRQADVYPYLARLLNLPLESAKAERLQYLSAEALRGRMLDAYAAYLEARAKTEPVVLVWEDLHWIDPSSLAILERLLPLARAVPLLIALVFRPEPGQMTEFHGRLIADGYPSLTLQPLSRSSSVQLLDHLLHLEQLPATIQQMILEKTEGNAFFLEEVLRSLIDAGLVVIEGGKAAVTEAVHGLKALDVPDTLQGVIAARIDRLPNEHKQTLQIASVIGRVFQEPVLAYLFKQEISNDTLTGALSRLQEREFIRLRAEMEYIFKHAITQDVAYNSLLVARRKTLHKVTAEAIEALFPDHLDELSGTIAYHYQHAEIADKTVHYLLRAADRAKSTFANAEAITFYRDAIEQIKKLDSQQDRLIGLYENLADVLILVGQYEESRAMYEEGIALTGEDELVKARLHRKLARTWEMARQYQESLALLARAQATIEGMQQRNRTAWQEWVQIELDLSRIYYWLGDTESIIAGVKRTEPILNEYGTPVQRATFFNSRTLGALRQEKYSPSPQTIEFARTAAAASVESGSVPDMAWNMFGYGFSLLWAGFFDEADAQLHKALEFAQRTGDISIQARALTYLTLTYRKQGRLEQVKVYAERSLAIAKIARMMEYTGMARANMAWLAAREGDFERAREHAERGFEELQQVPQGFMFSWIICGPLVAIHTQAGEIEDAVRYARLAIDPKSQIIPEAIRQHLEAAIAAWEGGDAARTGHSLANAIATGQPSGYF